MIEIRNFEIDGNTMYYFGENHYTIEKSVYDGYELTVARLDENGDELPIISYACANISTAIASIEALENGEEI